MYKVIYAKDLLRKRTEYQKKGLRIPMNLSYRAIAVKVGVSADSIHKWDGKDMSSVAIAQRAALKAAPKLFTLDEEAILAGWIVYKDLVFESSTTFRFKEFASNHFGREMSPSFVTKFLDRNHLSMKLPGNAKASESNAETIQKAVEFLESFEILASLNGLSPSQIKVFDKTYLQTSPWHKNIRHIGMKGGKSRKETPERGSVHEIWTTLSGDGTKGPFYVSTKDPKLSAAVNFDETEGHISYIPIKKSSNGKNTLPAERSMLEYLFHMIHIAKFFKEGDFLVFDGERSFATKAVKRYMSENGLYPFVIQPTQLHQFISPCDNSFHSVFKLAYYRKLSHHSISSITNGEKLRMARECFQEIDENTVRDMFTRCGLIAKGQDKKRIVYDLMFEGLGILNKHNEHRVQLYRYLDWCVNNDLEDLCSSLNEDILKFAGMIQ